MEITKILWPTDLSKNAEKALGGVTSQKNIMLRFISCTLFKTLAYMSHGTVFLMMNM